MKRYILAVAVFLLIAFLLAACSPSKGDTSQKRDDLCKTDVALQLCWGQPSAAGTGFHRSQDEPPLPGVHRVNVMVEAYDLKGKSLGVPVHMLAQGHTASGAIAFATYEDITTPDVVYYDLGPDVVQIEIQGIHLGEAGESLTFSTRIGLDSYPDGKVMVQNQSGENYKHNLLARVVVNVPKP